VLSEQVENETCLKSRELSPKRSALKEKPSALDNPRALESGISVRNRKAGGEQKIKLRAI